MQIEAALLKMLLPNAERSAQKMGIFSSIFLAVFIT
jgi:hypothetical protein